MNLITITPHPEIIFIMSSVDYLLLRADHQDIELFANEDVGFLILPVKPEQGSIQENIDRNGFAIKDTVLLLSPYDRARTDYVPVQDAMRDFALAKYFTFCELCGFLGATQVALQSMTIDGRERRLSGHSEGEITPFPFSSIEMDLEATSEQAKRLQSSIQISAKFAGDEPDFEKAQSLLAGRNLARDTTMMYLLNLRRRKLTELELTLDITSEANKKITVVSNVKVQIPTQLMNLRSSLEVLNDSRENITLSIKVVF